MQTETPTITQSNAALVRNIYASPELLKEAMDISTYFIREKVRELGFARKMCEPVFVTSADLDRTVESDQPSIILEKDMEAKAMTVPFRGQGESKYWEGEKVLVRYNLPIVFNINEDSVFSPSNKTEVFEADEFEDTETIAEVPFSVIEKVPVYPGCDGENYQLKKCMSDNISKHVAKNFNIKLAKTLGLKAGKKRISVQFKIDKNGNVTDIRARAPHPKLKEEAIRVIKLLPKMQPGKQDGKAVNVRYNLPIIFTVD